MAEWFVGPKLKKLIDDCSEYLQHQFKRQIGVKENLTRLRVNQPRIQALVSAASQARITDPTASVDKLIWPLRDAIDEAEDVLGEIDYTKRKEKRAGNMNKVHRAMSSLKKIGKRALKIDDPNLKKVLEIVQKLDEIVAEFIPILLLSGSTTQNQLQKYRVTGSVTTNNLIGRAKDKEFVIQWLRKAPPNEDDQMHDNISLLSIVGHGGMGKTALLQHVYNDKVTDEFELKMWVWVSNNFNAEKIITDMLGSLKKIRLPSEPLSALQESLKSEVMSKKFLLVLDDIWEDDEVMKDKIKWENVLAPLVHGGLGSKLLITTRMNSVASTIAEVISKKNEVLKLKSLKEDECLQILNNHAFADVENPNDHKELKSITRELVKKFSGTPLEAKVMGSVLKSSLDERHWTNVLNRGLVGYNDIIFTVKLSYAFLPIYLKNCFAFCGVFAKDHVFHKNDLVRMWIAVGFIESSHIQGETVEKIGGRYFDMLVKKSFFDKMENGYRMHYLLHELARSVSAQECFRIVGDEYSDLIIPETIRHLSVETRNLELLKKIGKIKDLQTLRITYKKSNHDFNDVLAKIIEENRSIRLLSVCTDSQKTIPKAIGTLKHLRYLYLQFPTICINCDF